MIKYSKAEILERVEELGREQPWNHQIELPYGIKTTDTIQVSHGKNLIKWERIRKYTDTINIKGKRVLDVGCSEGFFSLKLRDLGAKEIFAFDADELRIKKAKFVAEALGITNITYDVMNMFDDSIKKIGHFDFALCLGLLHRVPGPYELLRRLTGISDMILFEWKSLKKGGFNLPIMQFCGVKSSDFIPLSELYWLPTVQCVVEILKSLDFTHNFIIEDSPKHRSIIISSRFDNQVFKSKNIINDNKFTLSKSITKSYLRSIFELLKDKDIKWF